MKVELLHATPLTVCATAIRQCHNTHDKSDCGGEKDLALIERVGNQHKHGSALRHLMFNFNIDGVSRGCMFELIRHNHTEYDDDDNSFTSYIPNDVTVKSSRYTLNELKQENNFLCTQKGRDRAKRFVVFTDNDLVNDSIACALERLRCIISMGVKPDIAKYCIPDAYKTALTWSINAQSMQNFLALRTANSAHFEVRELANKIYDAIPETHKYLFDEFVVDKEGI